MKRFGFIIKTGGDPEITGALQSGVDQGTRLAIAQRSSDAVRRVDMMRHTPEELDEMIMQARLDYGRNRPLPGWAARMLGLYGLACYVVGMSWRRLTASLGM